jgi:glutamate synthase (NADPH) large chain
MSELGFRTVEEMIGQVDVLKQKENVGHWKIKEVDLSPILYKEPAKPWVGLYKQMDQDHGIDKVMDWKLMEAAIPALENKEKVYAEFPIQNTDRAICTIVSHEISKKYEKAGLPEDTINFKFRGSAGQSFGAFGAPGLRLQLEGEANDYFGKGLSGGKLIVYPDREAKFNPSENIIIGNVAFYGATSGEAYIRGLAGERFCVRNSGVKAVVEGIGDHGCEYMTGGVAVILGKTGRNFAAGMSGGIAYVYNPQGDFADYCNMELVDFDPLEFEDIDMLRKLIENHLQYTGSDVAEAVLANWSENLGHFIKVMPRDYKAAILKNQQANLKEAI